VAFSAFAIALPSGCNSWKSHASEKEVAAAEDAVYEAVVRDMVTPVDGPPRISQLVFDVTLRTELKPGGDLESCKESTRKNLSLAIAPPLYDSLVDKAYRFFTRSDPQVALHADTIRNFLERSCTAGPLSQTFHTDLPRSFISAEHLHFRGWPAYPIPKNDPKSFERLYPGASGIISFSHAGFDSTLDEAIVSTGFVCGGLCGTGHRYILRKKSGRWEVVNGLMVWVS
jgi:hypothetical protein